MIAPIVGKFRKGVIRDIGGALSLGIIGGYSFWYYYHVRLVQAREAYYAKLEASKA